MPTSNAQEILISPYHCQPLLFSEVFFLGGAGGQRLFSLAFDNSQLMAVKCIPILRGPPTLESSLESGQKVRSTMVYVHLLKFLAFLFPHL